MLTGSQRRALITTVAAYRTVSSAALQVIAAVFPIHLFVEIRRRVYSRACNKQEAEAWAEEPWAREWESGNHTAQWTRRLIRDLKAWLPCPFRKTNHFLVQFLTGHGSFTAYKKRIGKVADGDCPLCHVYDDASHLLNCRKTGTWSALQRPAGRGF